MQAIVKGFLSYRDCESPLKRIKEKNVQCCLRENVPRRQGILIHIVIKYYFLIKKIEMLPKVSTKETLNNQVEFAQPMFSLRVPVNTW